MKKRLFFYTQFLIVILFISKAQLFEEVKNTIISTEESGSRTAGFIDFNNDEWIDLFISNGPDGGAPDEIYINKGNDEFELLEDEAFNSARIPSVGVTWIDINNNKRLDCFVGSWYGRRNILLENTETEFIIREDEPSYVRTFTESAAWADYDNDGYLDVVIANSNESANNLYRNLGGKFTEISLDARVSESRSANWADYDNDGDQDLLITNEDDKLYFFRNNDGTMERGLNVFSGASKRTFGASWADYDNDGDLDLFLANFKQANALLENTGDGNFLSREGSGLSTTIKSSIGSSWGDIDNDGDLDLYVTNGFGGNDVNELYLNNGDKTFTMIPDDPSVSSSGWSYGVAMGDYNNDGFLDLLIANTFDNAQKNALMKNLTNQNRWLQLDLLPTVSNYSGIGTRVTLFQSDEGVSSIQTREITSTSGYCGINDYRVHFGLGLTAVVDSIMIKWPLGHEEWLYNPELSQTITIEESIPENFVLAHFLVLTNELNENEEIYFNNNSKYDENSEVEFEWDFDGDGVIDSEQKSPKFVFTESGVYDCRLTVRSGSKTSTYQRKLIVEKVLKTEKNDQNLVLFPNPTINNEIHLISDDKITSAQCYSIDGRLIDHTLINNGYQYTFSFTDKSDMIFLHLELESGKKITKTILFEH